jgi:hypothetical protein
VVVVGVLGRLGGAVPRGGELVRGQPVQLYCDLVDVHTVHDARARELRQNGYRASVVRAEGGARIWSRQGKDLTGSFPDVAAAAEQQLAPGVVVDGVI